MTPAPATIAERFAPLDATRSLRLAGEQGADGTLRVVVQLVTGGRRELLFSCPPNRLHDLARELAKLAGELGLRP
jgi:hypothetical protein